MGRPGSGVSVLAFLSTKLPPFADTLMNGSVQPLFSVRKARIRADWSAPSGPVHGRFHDRIGTDARVSGPIRARFPAPDASGHMRLLSGRGHGRAASRSRVQPRTPPVQPLHRDLEQLFSRPFQLVGKPPDIVQARLFPVQRPAEATQNARGFIRCGFRDGIAVTIQSGGRRTLQGCGGMA